MISWGISANSHDAALAVFANEHLVFASHSERFSGIKNDPNLHINLIKYARQFGEPDEIYWYEQPIKKTIRQFWAGQGWLSKENNIKQYLSKYGITAPITYNSHHLSHAAAGYYTSSFDDACIVVIDAIGEFDTTSIWHAKDGQLKKLWSQTYPDSIGLFYSAMTQRIGLKPNEDEYILMGMAAYGDPARFSKRMYADFIQNRNAIKFKKNLHRGCLDWALELRSREYFDIAAATQAIYEDLVDTVLFNARIMSRSDNLILMGGCALNCSANQYTNNHFDKTWIMPNPGDAGSAIGAVLAKNPDWRIDPTDFTPYLGYDMGSTTKNEEIVKYILQHKICGVARDRAEFGPRALGNRSLLADPRGDTIKDRVNIIKHRQKFRPFAPAILAEFADQYFDMPRGWAHSPYMQTIARCKQPKKFPAICHVDDTSRVQTVSKNSGTQLRQLLELWYEATGCPMLLNTSLNIKGHPMVNTHSDAEHFENHYGVRVFT
jgi:carbamoyltransferase